MVDIAKQEPLKTIISIVNPVTGKKVYWDDLPQEKKVEIANDITIRIAAVFGMRPVDKERSKTQ